jgi:hypothetical protein
MAFFSDEEEFANNELVAGELDLKVSWEEHYSDWLGEEQEFARMPESGEDPDLSLPAGPDPRASPIELVFSDRDEFMDATLQEQFPDGGLGEEEDPCEALADVPQDLEAPVISLGDVKPGDFGEVTFDFAACDNPAYLWLTGELRSESENGLTEPESEDPDEDGTGGGGGDGGGGGGGGGPFDAVSGAGDTITAQELAETLLPEGSPLNIQSASYTGAPEAGGTFSGGGDVYGVEDGIVLSSGDVENIEEDAGGPDNNVDDITRRNDRPGDSDLLAISDDGTVDETLDAAVLEFDFTVPEGEDQVFFNFIFASDEYNEFVDDFNDTFGFFINPGSGTPEETNVAMVNGDPVGVNTINEMDNAALFNDNDPGLDDGETPSDTPFATEADGFTDVLTVEADVNPGETNTFKLAIADANDENLDSWVLIQGESLGTEPDTGDGELADALRARAWYDDGDNVNQDDEEVFVEGSLSEVLSELSSGLGVPLDGDHGDDFDELDDDPAAETRGCYTASPDVHYVAFQWWLPIDHGNEVQGDSVSFDLGFYTEQCRHNDGSGQGMGNDGDNGDNGDDGDDGDDTPTEPDTTEVTVSAFPDQGDDLGATIEVVEVTFTGGLGSFVSTDWSVGPSGDENVSVDGDTIRLEYPDNSIQYTADSFLRLTAAVPTGSSGDAEFVYEPDDDSQVDNTDPYST